ncbi:MAG: mannitol dehydrogenase family protein [Spirochaetaceae bacterium]|jgi:fructuronate reductase|nr:mannitol dehydrogenase family protein [Spirochaetaceae bacterium]
MLELNLKSLRENRAEWEKAGFYLPAFDVGKARHDTAAAPVWAHIGTGNLYKAYHAMLAQELLEKGLTKKGVIAVVPNDRASIDHVFKPHDNLWVQVVMKASGELVKTVCASTTEVLLADPLDKSHWGRLAEVFRSSELQLVTLAVTEKAYDLWAMDGSLKPEVEEEFSSGLARPRHLMVKLAALLLERFQNGGAPLAVVSTDNFSHNGDRLKKAVLTVAKEWGKRAIVEEKFARWLEESGKVSFPLSMIDKITPFPAEKVAGALAAAGVAGMEVQKSERGSFNAAFVNTEEAEYLVIEDVFPNGRPPLEKAGVYFTDRETVDKVERMKVCTCLNPLHTALAVTGCVLGFTSIAGEMKDPDLAALAAKIGYDEGLPVVTDPGIIKPSAFIDEVLTKRLPNPAIPDTPQRIATDTSQKLGIRFGETIKLYAARPDLDVNNLKLIPLVIAVWCRYLLGIDDAGKPFAPSPDPLLAHLRDALKGVTAGNPDSGKGKLKAILSNEKIFGVDLYKAGLGERIEGCFAELLAGPGAVRKTLQKYLK